MVCITRSPKFYICEIWELVKYYSNVNWKKINPCNCSSGYLISTRSFGEILAKMVPLMRMIRLGGIMVLHATFNDIQLYIVAVRFISLFHLQSTFPNRSVFVFCIRLFGYYVWDYFFFTMKVFLEWYWANSRSNSQAADKVFLLFFLIDQNDPMC